MGTDDRATACYGRTIDAIALGERAFEDALAELAALADGAVDDAVEAALLALPAVAWSRGWQPAEVVRQARRRTNVAIGRLAATVVFADHLGRDPSGLHPSWARQVAALEHATDVPFRVIGRDRWFAMWQLTEHLDRAGALRSAILLDVVIRDLQPLEELIPPPGASTRRPPPDIGVRGPADPVLSKVRALLAKAESTTFPAEAEAFTAKAQELMTRFAVGHAALVDTPGRAGSGSAERLITRRLPIDEPYIEAKSLMLQLVAEHTRCRSAFDRRYALTTVIGNEADVEATELLFNSLLLQAEVALTIESHQRPAGSRRRSRGFRGAFLVAYATRIGERLAAINDAVLDSLDGDEHDVDGWHDPARARGTAAADRARLHDLDLDLDLDLDFDGRHRDATSVT